MSPDVIPVPSGGIAACPVCRGPLGLADRELWCDNGHRFDRSREGFVNLLRAEGLDTMPQYLADRVWPRGGGA